VTKSRTRSSWSAVQRGWMPTHKWFAAQAVALGAVATSAIDSGWDATESKLMVGWAVQALVTYFLPNSPTPGGVPDARPKPPEAP
jgi:hypothetical protein